MAFLDLSAELSGRLPGLPPNLADTFINRALTTIYGERSWSFLQTDGVVNCPAMITTGTVNITQYSDSVTLDSDASTAIASQLGISAVPGILQMQIRFGTGVSIGGLYSIIAYDDSTPTAVVLTLNRVVQEATNATSEYQFYRALITPPITDFLRWESLVDYANAITLTGNAITLSSQMFDVKDPQRTAQGLSYYLGGWGGNRTSDPITGATVPNATVDAGTPIYEFWPHPTQGQAFYCRFRRRGQPLVYPTDTQPPEIPDALVIERALMSHGYMFAMANIGTFPAFKGVNLPTLIQASTLEYRRLLTETKKNDDAQQLQSVYNRGHGLRSRGQWGTAPFPLDSAYIQSHLLMF